MASQRTDLAMADSRQGKKRTGNYSLASGSKSPVPLMTSENLPNPTEVGDQMAQGHSGFWSFPSDTSVGQVSSHTGPSGLVLSSNSVWDPSEAVPIKSYLKENPSKICSREVYSQPGPSGLAGSSSFDWDHLDAGPSTSATISRRRAEKERSEASSPSSESSLGDSRSPDVLWRDDFSSREEECAGNIPTRMFSNTSKRFRKSYADDYYFSRHANVVHSNDSCVSDMSESSPDSANCSAHTSPKDESNGSGMNGHSSSGMNSDQEKISQTTFDKVLIDANQRRQIRNKVRNAGTDSGSDSSSGNTCLDTVEVVGTSATGFKVDSNTSESSGIGANYMSAQCDLMLPGSTMVQTPSGVTNSSTGVSTMYNSQGHHMSIKSKEESMSSRSSGRKRQIPWSLARYYHHTKCPNHSTDKQSFTDEGSEFGGAHNKPAAQTDRKRKRFHRTFTALRQCGLLDLTMQTASLMEQNTKLQKQLGDLHRQAHLMYHTVSHFSKLQPNAFDSPEAQKVMEGLKEMVEKNPVGVVDMSTFESTSRDSPANESGAFTMSNLPASSYQKSTGSVGIGLVNPGTTFSSQDNGGPRNSADSAFQSSITRTSSSSEKSAK